MKNHHQAVFSSHSDDIPPGRDMSPDRGENIVITKIATVTKMLIMMMMMMMNRMVKKTRTGRAHCSFLQTSITTMIFSIRAYTGVHFSLDVLPY